jgi:hypothetical protein
MSLAGVMTVLPVSMGNCVRSGIVGSVRMAGVCVSMTRVSVTGVTMRVAMTVSMATETTNRHPCKANSAKRECGEIYVH